MALFFFSARVFWDHRFADKITSTRLVVKSPGKTHSGVVAVSRIFGIFIPNLGEMIQQFDERCIFFKWVGKNHQLVEVYIVDEIDIGSTPPGPQDSSGK